uniref:Uncharacterized protein n=1 Tax=Rhizophora mucronata TaxID=61149 RepID=A0A2P2NBU3_RHIMU
MHKISSTCSMKTYKTIRSDQKSPKLKKTCEQNTE